MHVYTVPKIRCMYYHKWGSLPIPTFMYLWVIYLFPGSVCLFGCSKIGRPILGIYKSLRDAWCTFCFGNNESVQFHFWEHLNRNHTYILVSHRPFIFSVENCHWWSSLCYPSSCRVAHLSIKLLSGLMHGANHWDRYTRVAPDRENWNGGEWRR
jgi:hypothetical protein